MITLQQIEWDERRAAASRPALWRQASERASQPERGLPFLRVHLSTPAPAPAAAVQLRWRSQRAAQLGGGRNPAASLRPDPPLGECHPQCPPARQRPAQPPTSRPFRRRQNKASNQRRRQHSGPNYLAPGERRLKFENDGRVGRAKVGAH